MKPGIFGAAAALLVVTSACGKPEASNVAQPSAKTEPAAIPAYVKQAVADSGRDAQKMDDARRKPAEIIAFSGVKPGDKVLELIPGTGYWTRILSKIVGPTGHIYAVWPQSYARYSVGNVQSLQAMAKTAAYSNVSVEVQPTPVLTAPEKLDLVFTSQNYHDYPAEFMGDNGPSVLNNAVFKMLKPGGTFIVIDHLAAPGTPLAQTRELHRIDPALVRQETAAAGFEFVGSTDVLRNRADQYELKVFDPKVRGKTDKFAYRFRKPAA